MRKNQTADTTQQAGVQITSVPAAENHADDNPYFEGTEQAEFDEWNRQHAALITAAARGTQPATWKLETVQWQQEDLTLATGTEQEVKDAAAKLFEAAYALPTGGMDKAAALFSDLYLTAPDGTHYGAVADGPGFHRGDMPTWADFGW